MPGILQCCLIKLCVTTVSHTVRKFVKQALVNQQLNLGSFFMWQAISFSPLCLFNWAEGAFHRVFMWQVIGGQKVHLLSLDLHLMQGKLNSWQKWNSTSYQYWSAACTTAQIKDSFDAKKYKVWTDLLLHVGPAQMHPEHTVIMTK